MKIKKKQNINFIEMQNQESLRLIEEKRLKFKNLPKANKEKMDNNNLHKHWMWIVKKEIPKMHKIYQKFKADIDYNAKRWSTGCQKEVRKKWAKIVRLQKEANMRARRISKDVITFWRRRDKEITEIRRRNDKSETEKRKHEEDLKEAVIQKKRLEFLMKQSDLYTFFMWQKLGLDNDQKPVIEGEENKKEEPSNKEVKETDPSDPNCIENVPHQLNKKNKVIFKSVKVEIDEKAAQEGVTNLINEHREHLRKFDQETDKLRVSSGGERGYVSNLEKCKNEDLDQRLDNPDISGSASQLVEVPKSFIGELKEYQLKGEF